MRKGIGTIEAEEEGETMMGIITDLESDELECQWDEMGRNCHEVFAAFDSTRMGSVVGWVVLVA